MARDIEPKEAEALARLTGVIRMRRARNVLRSRYADAEQRAALMGIAIPPSMEGFAAVLGWPAKTVDVLARQLVPNGFTGGSGTVAQDLEQIFAETRMQLLEQQLIHAAVKHGVSFGFVSRGEDDEPDPLVTVRSALDATAEIDPRSGRTSLALEIVSRDESILYVPGKALTLQRKSGSWVVEEEVVTAEGRVLCTPYVHGGSLEKPFGRSRITRPVMNLTDIAVRILLRQEVSAEFFSAPQRYMLGATADMFKDEDGNPIPAWEAIVGAAVVVPDVSPDDPNYNDLDAKLNRVQVGQFTQMSMQPHSDHLKSIAMMFAGETAIPVNYLGLILDNPPSAESIAVMNADLQDVAAKEQVGLGLAREDLARNALISLGGAAGEAAARGLKARWLETDAKRAAVQQTIVQQVQAQILPPDSPVTLAALGYREDQIAQILADQRRARGIAGLAGLGAAPAENQDKATADALRAKFDALGVAIRSGVDPETAAAQLGLTGLKFTGAVPVSLRLPTADASGLEDGSGAGGA